MFHQKQKSIKENKWIISSPQLFGLHQLNQKALNNKNKEKLLAISKEAEIWRSALSKHMKKPMFSMEFEKPTAEIREKRK